MAPSESLLDTIQIASPCEVDWASMTGDDRSRHCGDCKLQVYNLSAMTRDEAQALLSGVEGRLCARFARRRDGTVVTRDCGPIRARIRRRMRRLRMAAAALLGLVSTLALSACGRTPDTARVPPAPKEAPKPLPGDQPPLMGVVCPSPPDAGHPEIMGEIEIPQHAMGRVALPQPKPVHPQPDAPKR